MNSSNRSRSEQSEATKPKVDEVAPSNLPAKMVLGILAATPIYLIYHPSDSIEVESGGALWFAALAILFGTATLALHLLNRAKGASLSPPRPCDRIVDVSAWAMAAWMMLVAFMTSPPGNLRLATNEAWLWVGAALFFTAARRWCAHWMISRGVVCLLLALAVLTAAHALHQDWISLPQTRAEYREDPASVYKEFGMEEPPPWGSSTRMLFENRLFDGGPMATFALANSMVSVILVGTLLVIGLLRIRWNDSLPRSEKMLLLVVLAICILGLFAARSRSALGAAVVGGAAIWMLFGRPTESDGDAPRKRRSLIAIGFAAMSAVASVAVGVLVFGRKEWAEQAPASLEFRLQYWRATIRLVSENLIFGAGPGNFRTMYLRYREPGAGEAIADPHNFVFETMAAGGLVALGLLIVLVGTIVWIGGFRPKTACEGLDNEKENHPQEIQLGNVWWLGAVVGLVLVWFWGLVINDLPDWEGQMLAIPLAVGAAWLAWRVSAPIVFQQIRRLAGLVLLSLLIHLCAAGGWTVPGVAVFVWLLAAIVCRRLGVLLASLNEQEDSESDIRRLNSGYWRVACAAMCGIVMVFVLRSMSLEPVTAAHVSMLRATTGSTSAKKSEIQNALEADPWALLPAMELSGICRWRLVEKDLPDRRREWRESIDIVKQRCGDDPVAFRAIGQQAIHIYQRYGRAEDLDMAAESISIAVQFSPTDQMMIAQLAAIVAARGNQPKSLELAQKASELADLSNDVVQDLERQYILVPERVLTAEPGSPVSKPASEVLSVQLGANQNRAGSVNRDNGVK